MQLKIFFSCEINQTDLGPSETSGLSEGCDASIKPLMENHLELQVHSTLFVCKESSVDVAIDVAIDVAAGMMMMMIH